MDWLDFFDEFFRQEAASVVSILDAEGCREGWLQGQIFLHAKMRNPALRLRTNATRHKYDLFCESEPMVGEVKISGGDYQPKNRGLIREAARKLLNAAAEHAGYQKYLLLVVDNRHPDTPLGQWLLGEFDWPRRRYRKLPVGDHVLVRIWDMSGCDLQEPTTKGARDR